MSVPQYGDYEYEIYMDGLDGRLPKYPVDFASLERAASQVLPSWVYHYVAGGSGDERTQHANVEAFSRYGIVPRMLVGADERDLSVSLFDMTLPTPVFMCPVGVIGLWAQDFHGEIQVRRNAIGLDPQFRVGLGIECLRIEVHGGWLCRCCLGLGRGSFCSYGWSFYTDGDSRVQFLRITPSRFYFHAWLCISRILN